MTVLIIIGVIASAAIAFTFWCCCVVAAEADKRLEKLYEDDGK